MMPTNRWPKKVWQHDRNTNMEAWFSDIQYILNFIGLSNSVHLETEVDTEFVQNELSNQ